jgi:hypothetical protein
LHANATVRHSKNCIRSLQDVDGLVRTQHDEKALLLWESFKDRLGQSEYAHMHFDLETLLTPIDDLDSLVTPFSNEEIDEVVKNLKTDKSLWPGGFNTDFMKNVGMSLNLISMIYIQVSMIMIFVCKASMDLSSP